MIASGVTNIVLLVVAAAWVAVLVPPLLRSRVENRPGSSIVDFRRQLASLQRTVPTRGVTPMSQMARPLAPTARRHAGAPMARPAVGSSSLARSASWSADTRVGRSHAAPVRTASRPVARAASTPVRRPSSVSARRQLQQRRQNVLMVLGGITVVSAMAAFATASATLAYVFVLAAVSLAGYCYKLVQLKNEAAGQPYGALRR